MRLQSSDWFIVTMHLFHSCKHPSSKRKNDLQTSFDLPSYYPMKLLLNGFFVSSRFVILTSNSKVKFKLEALGYGWLLEKMGRCVIIKFARWIVPQTFSNPYSLICYICVLKKPVKAVIRNGKNGTRRSLYGPQTTATNRKFAQKYIQTQLIAELQGEILRQLKQCFSN